jgi:MATE family multidrug resistance protein
VTVLAAELLLIGAAFQLFDGLQTAGISVLRGIKDTRFPMVACLVSYWGVAIPVGYGLARGAGWGPAGIWWGLTLGLACAAFAHLARFHWMTRGSKMVSP